MVKQYDFSSHADSEELIKYLGNLKWTTAQKKVFLVHGDKDTMMAFAEKIKPLGYQVETPIENQSFIV